MVTNNYINILRKDDSVSFDINYSIVDETDPDQSGYGHYMGMKEDLEGDISDLVDEKIIQMPFSSIKLNSVFDKDFDSRLTKSYMPLNKTELDDVVKKLNTKYEKIDFTVGEFYNSIDEYPVLLRTKLNYL